MKTMHFTIDDWASFGFWQRVKKNFSENEFARISTLCRYLHLEDSGTSWLNLHGPRGAIKDALEDIL